MCAMVKGDSSATPLLVLINEVYELHKDDEHKKGEQKKQGAKMVNITWLNRWSEVPADCHWTDSARRAEKLSVDKVGAGLRAREGGGGLPHPLPHCGPDAPAALPARCAERRPGPAAAPSVPDRPQGRHPGRLHHAPLPGLIPPRPCDCRRAVQRG